MPQTDFQIKVPGLCRPRAGENTEERATTLTATMKTTMPASAFKPLVQRLAPLLLITIVILSSQTATNINSNNLVACQEQQQPTAVDDSSPHSRIAPESSTNQSQSQQQLHRKQEETPPSPSNSTEAILNELKRINDQLLTGQPAADLNQSSVPKAGGSSDATTTIQDNNNDVDDDRERDDESADNLTGSMNLMNAAQDKLIAVKSLLDVHQQQQLAAASADNGSNSSTSEQQQHQHPTPASADLMQCTHKGRQYSHGQTVFIEDQPCLNCTCKMAILQCYLRVCPPIVSLEAQKRKALQLATGSQRSSTSGDHQQQLDQQLQDCRLVKEAHQCCPVMKCSAAAEPKVADNSIKSPTDANSNQQQSGRLQPSSPSPGSSSQQQQNSPVINRSINSPVDSQPSKSAADQAAAASSIVATSVQAAHTNSYHHHHQDGSLPKLTVINGPAGQRDSILLITSNPHSSSFKRQFSNSTTSSQGSADNGGQAEQAVVSSAPIIEALLETIYSSAANQLSGLNLHGSCMINGSLYFEGSAVLPDSAGQQQQQQCQYCYCIRQKVMCVKPRCHLIISGCTPKYSNEFACCPTSYACDLPNSNSLAQHTSSNSLARLTSPGSTQQTGSGSGLLPVRLSAAFEEAISRVLTGRNHAGGPTGALVALPSPVPEPPPTQYNSLDTELTARQVDGAGASIGQQQQPQAPAEDKSLRSMINSLLANFAPAESLNGPATTSGDANETAAAAVGPMVKTTATLTTIVTTTNKLPDSDDYSTTTMTSSHKPISDFNEGLNDSDNDAEDEHLHEGTKPKRKSGNNKRVPSSTIGTTTSSIATMSDGFSTPSSIGTSSTALPVQDSAAIQQATTTSTPPRTTTQQSASSVADFLEPMNKLGPHMSSPTTPSGCTENGRNYAIGEQIPTLESCKHCYCGPEGVKECKMVECNLRGAHGCKPITPEGHCCPIRFDCGSPPQGADSGNDRTGDRPVPVVKTTRLVLDDDENDERHRNSFGETTPGARYPISGDNVPPTQANSSEPTPNMAGLTEELNQFIMRIRANNSSGGAGAGNTEAAQQQQRSPLLPANNEGPSFSNEPANLSSLTSHDDASSFDEHQDGSPERHEQLSGANRKRDYDSFKPATAAAAAVPIPPGMVGIPSIEPAIIGNLAPSAASRALDSSDDLLSTVAPPRPLSEPNNSAETGSGAGGQRDMRSTHAHAGSAGHLHGETLSTVIDQPSPTSNSTAAGPPSSTSSGSSDDYVDLDDAEPTAGRNHQDHTDSKEPAVRYQLDELNNNNSTTSPRNEAELVHVRKLRDDRINANHGHRHLEEGHQTSTSAPAPAAVVDFDDDTASSNSSSGSGNGTGFSTEANVSDTLPAQPPSHQSTSNAADAAARAEQGSGQAAADAQDNSVSSTPSSALQPTTGSPIGVNLSDRPVTPEMSGWIKLLPQWTRSFGQRLSGLDSFQGAATTGQQPNEQLQHQYGRSNPYATARLVAENVSLPIVSTASRASDQPARESARSTHQNPFMSMLRSIIATAAASPPSGGGDRELNDKTDSADQQLAASNESVGQPRRSGNLVMRPLAPAEWQSSLIQDSREPVGNVNENNRADNSIFQSRALSSTFEPSLSPSELEIVTAAVPNEPEVFGQTRRVPPPRAGSADTKELVVMASSSFARRSDVADSMDTGPEDSTVPVVSGKRQGQDQEASVQYFANLAPAGGPRQSGGSNGAVVSQQQRAPFHFVQVHKLNRASDNQAMQSGGGGGGNQRGASLTCYDSATNKTYQLNERIPKLDEPCKACTCLLGREICQPLVCPEKPADNCREEHRPGECCPNYLCATGLGPVASSPPVASTSEAPAPAPTQSQPHSGRLISAPQATSSGQARNLTPTMDGPGQRTTNSQPSASAGAAQVNFRPPSSGFQIRTGDLASLLPPHLRFRPNQQHQQGAASGPQANQLSQSGQQQFLFNYDNNNQQLSFSNNEQALRQRQQQQQQSGQRIFVNNNNNNQQLSLMGASIGTGQGDARYRPVQGIQSAATSYLSGPNSPVVRPSLLMHPQRFIQSVTASRRNDDSPVINLNSIQTNQIVSTGGSHENKLAPNQAQQVAAIPAAGSSTNQALMTNFITNNLNQQPLQHPLVNQVSSMRFPVPTDNRQQQQVVPAAVRLTNSGQTSGGGNREPALTPTSWKLPMSSLDSNPTSMLVGQAGFQQNNPVSQPKQVAMMKPPQMATSMNSIAPIAHSGPSVSRPVPVGALDQPTAINMLATSDSNKPAQMDKILFKQSQQQKQPLPALPSPPPASFAATNAASSIQRQFTTTTRPDTPPFGANFDSGFRPIVGPQEQQQSQQQQLIVKTSQDQAVPFERPLPAPPSTTTTSATTIESSLATSSGASSMGSTPTSTTRFQVPDSTPTSTSTIRYSQPLDSTSDEESRAPEATTSESPHSQSVQPTNGQTVPAGPELGQHFNIADDSTTASPSTTTTSTTTTTTPPPPPTTTTTVTSPSSMAPAVFSVQTTTANTEDDRKTSFGPASSTQTVAVGQLGNEESASNLPASSGQDEPTEAAPFDPFAFRVSECDIYGRVYKVGQPIDELSDSCKRCTCTASGVDCQTKC